MQPLTADAWSDLLERAGLTEISASTYTIQVQAETRAILQRYGVGGMLGVMGRMFLLYLKSPDYRRFVKGVSQTGVALKNLDEYFGYGLYLGRKP